MTVKLWLNNATGLLNKTSVPTARLDCLILLEDVTGKDRSWLLAHDETELSTEQIAALDKLVERRANHEPLSYIRKKTEFYGWEYYIDHSVLEPRPESETMIDLLKQFAPKSPTIIDVGTGSGALAITAKLELPSSDVLAIDIDPECLRVTKKNAELLNANIALLQGNLVEPAADQLDGAVLLCNLPYVPDSHTINQAAMHEPTIAIFGGQDGLDPFRTMFEQIQRSGQRPALILTESLPFQHQSLSDVANQHGYTQTKEDDFIQAFTPIAN